MLTPNAVTIGFFLHQVTEIEATRLSRSLDVSRKGF